MTERQSWELTWVATRRQEAPAQLAQFQDFKDFSKGPEGRLEVLRSLAPLIGLVGAALSVLLMLLLVGYPHASVPQALLDEIGRITLEPFTQRGALALSGVTLAMTIVLAATSALWFGQTYFDEINSAPTYKKWVLKRAASALALAVAAIMLLRAAGFVEYLTTPIGDALLERAASIHMVAAGVPYVMFVLTLLVPTILAAGACLLLQPMREHKTASQAKAQLSVLIHRLDVLDQMLYIGALGMVFGTLQLSTALSLPLASLPTAAKVKDKAEVCRTLVSTASAAVAASAASAPSQPPAVCNALHADLERSERADDLRQFVRGVTLSVGLAFSTLLAVVYVQGLMGLRRMIESRRPSGTDPGGGEGKHGTLGDVDPLRRAATIVATLSPLLAGLLANAFSTG